jgi:GMC oxidoreductase
VLRSFKRMEDWEDGASDVRGAGGPIRVTRQKDLTPASQAFIEALAVTAGVKKIDDYNGDSQEGGGLPAERQRRAAVQLVRGLPRPARPAEPHDHHPGPHHPDPDRG